MTKYPNYLIIFLLTFINLCLANDTCPLKPNNSQNENENNSNILAIMNILKYLMKNFTYLLFGNFGASLCVCLIAVSWEIVYSK
uniref:Uncharacterized protein n=1 Tax=Meloidogyne enterolobii TaxID=390850 RepID=A0A6V7VP76_MELEN|nr:unnamed protein product [Meloidogyne enterolobii]